MWQLAPLVCLFTCCRCAAWQRALVVREKWLTEVKSVREMKWCLSEMVSLHMKEAVIVWNLVQRSESLQTACKFLCYWCEAFFMINIGAHGNGKLATDILWWVEERKIYEGYTWSLTSKQCMFALIIRLYFSPRACVEEFQPKCPVQSVPLWYI